MFLEIFLTNSWSAFIKVWPFFPLYGYRFGFMFAPF
nr:MAG TPA: hypothetical protein [Caudoviricetes sp.]DAR83642.1 MAG TPA: hypothetical protein [Caudoviricetes sp.]